MTNVLVVASESSARHDTGHGHPERPERVTAVERGIAAAGVDDALIRIPGRAASRDELLRVHQPGHLDRLEAFIKEGGRHIDADTTVSSQSWNAALEAAGSGLVAVEALDAGTASSAFVPVRPPGHHATGDTAMGFCLVNNVAVTAGALAARGQRVLIVDWDVHHGNGTQDIFWDDPRVLYVSTHEFPLYPGTGRVQETGGAGAPGLNVNVPLPRGSRGDGARAALDEVAAPVVDAFGPDWVLVSAGFDAHRNDPLAGLEWSSGDYADLTRVVSGWAPGPGRTIVFLEGGYDLRALTDSTAATVAALAGADQRPEAATAGGPGREAVRKVVELRKGLAAT